VQNLPLEVDEQNRLISLYELMFSYDIHDLVLMLSGILQASNTIELAAGPMESINSEWLKNLSVSLDGLYRLGSAIEIDSSLQEQVKDLRDSTANGSCTLASIVVMDRLQQILGAVYNNLKSRKFMYVPREQAGFWNNLELFGDDFLIGFPRAAVLEMTEAGNCYASGRWTACVFHAMRVAEHGLRRLARRLRVTIKSKGKTCPLEYGDWEQVITATRNKITELRKLPRGPKREDQLQFYSDMASHGEYIKDIWRNETSHTRRQYNQSESLAALKRVEDFVRPLAKGEADAAVRKRLRERKLKSLGVLGSQWDLLQTVLKSPSMPEVTAPKEADDKKDQQ
jgi:hypothetical protein